jgi:hypothetical protein
MARYLGIDPQLSVAETKKPTPTDIVRAIELIEEDEWIDPVGIAPTYWSCELYDPQGRRAGDGVADTPGLAMAMAWLCVMSPDALIDGEVLDEVPLIVPDGWRFELTPPVELATLPWAAIEA